MDSIQQRLTAGLAIKGGSRGSLTRCVGRLRQLVAAQQQRQQRQQPTNETSDEGTRRDMTREVRAMYVEITKLALRARRQRAELEDMPREDSLDADVRTARDSVRGLRLTHQRARDTVACRREYEALARVVTTRYPTPRRILQARMDAIDRDTRTAREEEAHLDAQRRVREKQFAALVQCITDLKQSLTEPLQVDVDTAAIDTDPTSSTTNGKSGTDNDAMDVDNGGAAEGAEAVDRGGQEERQNNVREDENEEAGELYADL